MHDGHAIELLWCWRPGWWRVKPLFVRAEERDEFFGTYDDVTFLHGHHQGARN